MKLILKGFINDNHDAVIVIQCQCGNRRMLNENDNMSSKAVFVYRYGAPAKNLRCNVSEPVMLKLREEGRLPCRERYLLDINISNQPHCINVAHLPPRPEERVLEEETINFPSRSG